VKAWIEGKKRTGPWKVRWREQVGGAWVKRASPSLSTRVEAEGWCEAKNLTLARAASVVDRRHPSLAVGELFTKWRADRLAEGEIRETYAEEVRGVWVGLCESMKWLRVCDITADGLNAWRSTKERGAQKPIRIVKSLLSWARQSLNEPVDLAVLTMRPGSTKHPRASPHLLTDTQIRDIIARADVFGASIGALIRHLSTYGCRPIDACRLTVGDWNRRMQEITLRRTKNGDDVTHPVDADMAARIDALVANRGPREPLYQNPSGTAWSIDRLGCARQLVEWYVANIGNHVISTPAQRGIYCLKDYAITAMQAAGIEDTEKKLFTGHRKESAFERYKTTNRDRAKAALKKLGANHPRGGKVGGTSKLRGQIRGQKPQPRQTKKTPSVGKYRTN
jgi:integrase